MQTITQVNYNYDADNNFVQVGNAVAVAKDKSGNYDFSDVIKSTKTIENKEIESFEVSGTISLGINATGNITVNSTGSGGVFITSRNKGVKITETENPNNDVYSPLNVVGIETSKTDGNFADVHVIAKGLILVGGNGAIGTQDKPFTVSLTGNLLSARSNDEINLQKVGVA